MLNSKPSVIQTVRLDLVLLDPQALQASLVGNLTALQRILGVDVPQEWLEAQELIEMRLQQIVKELGYEPWSVRAMIERKVGQMIGHIGFHTRPGAAYLNAFAPDGVEFGLTVYPEFRRNGYAREASLGLMAWAHRQYSVSEFVMSISPNNVPSISLATRLGFRKIGSQVDEVDGVEDIYRLDYEDVV